MGYIGNQDYNIIEANIGTVTGTDTAANIVALPNDNGALWIASDTGHLFLNDGSQWHDVGQLQGDTGPQGVGVTGISKTSTSGLVDTYTVTFSDMSTTTYTITNGKGIVGVARTSGDGSEGTLDTYTITYNDSTTSTYDVYNGADGNTWLTGSTAPLAGDGSDGDLYLNTATSFYYEKVAGVWVLKGTLKGDAYSYSAAGALAGRGAYDTEAAGFGYLSLDEAVPTVYFKLSSASGDWSVGTAVGRGAGISSVTKTGTLGNVDTYTITYDDLSTSTFTVTNANIDDSQITTTNTWSAEKIVLALDDVVAGLESPHPSISTVEVSAIMGTTALLTANITNAHGYDLAGVGIQFQVALQSDPTIWTNKGAPVPATSTSPVSYNAEGLSIMTPYLARAVIVDSNNSTLAVASASQPFDTISEVVDADSGVDIVGTSFNTTNVTGTNATVSNTTNDATADADGAYATGAEIAQQAGQGNFSKITPFYSFKPAEVTMTAASTALNPEFTSEINFGDLTGKKLLFEDDGVMKEVVAGTVTKTVADNFHHYENPHNFSGKKAEYLFSNNANDTTGVYNCTTSGTLTYEGGGVSGFSSSNRLNLPTSILPTGQNCSIFGSFRTGSDVATRQSLITLGSTNPGIGIAIYNTNQLMLHGYSISSIEVTIQANKDYMFLATNNGGTGSIYIKNITDNQNWVSDTGPLGGYDNVTASNIGSYGGSYSWLGKIFGIAISSSILTTADVSLLLSNYKYSIASTSPILSNPPTYGAIGGQIPSFSVHNTAGSPSWGNATVSAITRSGTTISLACAEALVDGRYAQTRLQMAKTGEKTTRLKADFKHV